MDFIIEIDNSEDLETRINTLSDKSSGVFICASGEAQVSLNDKVYITEKDVLMIYTPYTNVRVLRRSDDWSGFLVGADLEVVIASIFDVPIKKIMQLREHPCIKVSPDQRERIMHMIKTVDSHMLLLANKSKNADTAIMSEIVRTLVRAVCLEFVDIFFDCSPMEDMPQSKEARIYNQFIVSLFNNIERERTVAAYAAEQNLTPGHFSMVVKKTSGRTALKWIEEIAVTKIKRYLADPRLSIKQIAKIMNFPDQSTFGRYFKSREGMSPLAYRRSRTKDD